MKYSTPFMYLLVNVASLGIIIGALFGGHINSWVDVVGGISGFAMMNALVYLFSPSVKEVKNG